MELDELPGQPAGYQGRILQYLSFRKARESLQREEDGLKKVVTDDLVAEGEEDDKGNFFLYLDAPVEGVRGVKRERRISQVMDEDAVLAIIKAHGLEDSCIEHVPVINEDALLAANYRGEITDDEMKSVYSPKESWAFVLVKE